MKGVWLILEGSLRTLIIWEVLGVKLKERVEVIQELYAS